MYYHYPYTLHPERDGGYYVTFTDVPAALTGGQTIDQCLDLAEDALAVALTFYLESNRTLPTPSPPEKRQYLISFPLVVAK